MKVVIPGGTGQVGTLLARKFRADGHEAVVFGRSQRDWAGAIDGSDVVINLAGRSVNCRYTEEEPDEIPQLPRFERARCRAHPGREASSLSGCKRARQPSTPTGICAQR